LDLPTPVGPRMITTLGRLVSIMTALPCEF
jgi:hypothetical protein